MTQTEFLLSETILDYKEDIIFNLWWDRCPSVKCQMALLGMTLFELQETEKLQDLEIELEGTFVGVIEEAWNL